MRAAGHRSAAARGLDAGRGPLQDPSRSLCGGTRWIISASATITGLDQPGSVEAPVTRVEVGGGYSLQRNLLLKVAYQHNTRDGRPRDEQPDLGAAQVVFWL